MFKTQQGLSYERTETQFTLLLRHHKSFWTVVLSCFLVGLSTLELEELLFLPVHQHLECIQETETCHYTHVQMHPFLFWQSEDSMIPIENIDNASYDSRYAEWEVELSQRTLTFYSGKDSARHARELQIFLQGETPRYIASTNHAGIGFFQLMLWLLFGFPLFLLIMDRIGRPHSTQSIFVDSQVVIIKRYGFMGQLKQSFYPTRALKHIQAELQSKTHKNNTYYYLHLRATNRQGKTIYLIKKVSTDAIAKNSHTLAYELFVKTAQEMVIFLHAQEIDVSFSY